MPGVEHHVVVDRRQSTEAVLHRHRIAAGQVGPTTPVEEERVAGDELAADQEALAARGVAGGVDQLDLDPADRHHVPGLVGGEFRLGDTGGPTDPRNLVPMDVHRAGDDVEECRDAGDVVPEDRPTDVIGVIVRGEDTGDLHAVVADDVDDRRRVVRRIDEDALTGRPVTDGVDEVHHLRRELIGGSEIASGEQLTEVEIVGLAHGSSVRCLDMERPIDRPGRPDRLTRLDVGQPIVHSGDRVAYVDDELAASFRPGDRVVVDTSSGQLLHVPAGVTEAVDTSVSAAVDAFAGLARCSDEQVTVFFESFADHLADSSSFAPIVAANEADVRSALERGRSTTRLVLSDRMRRDMIAGLRGWASYGTGRDEIVQRVVHDGWTVEARRAPLGVVAFVFEGRPNVFADAAGVVRTGNTVVFRIGSDALGTAMAITDHALLPALRAAGLPDGTVGVVPSPLHAAGWALFSDRRIGLAVARGSGPAVAQLGSVARQSGVPVSLHGTGGAWLVAAGDADVDRFGRTVEASLDRKVCNTLNVCCIVRSRASDLVPAFTAAVERAGGANGARLHATREALPYLPEGVAAREAQVVRPEGVSTERFVTTIDTADLGHEWEWESTPEVSVHVVDDVDEAVDAFNRWSPKFVASIITASADTADTFYERIDAPFVGDGFTRWVDGQYALNAPELGLSNWEFGRLLGRGGILSGDSVHTVRHRASFTDPGIRR
ncbi:MAG: gamma-glutamyl phosphate reductase [Actinomycetota bacterium]